MTCLGWRGGGSGDGRRKEQREKLENTLPSLYCMFFLPTTFFLVQKIRYFSFWEIIEELEKAVCH